LLASKGTCDTGAVPASSMGPANNWAEIANPQNLNVTFDFDVYSRNNQLLGHFRKTLPARSQTHVFLNQYIGESNVGYFRVQCVNQNTPLLVQSLFYGRTEGSSARIAWAYSSQAKQGVVLTNKYFAYNTYLGAANWLKLFNTVSDLAKTSIFTPEGSAITHNYSSISFSGTLDVPVHEQSGFNFFGLTKVEQALDTSSAELIRVYPTKAGTVGYIMNVPSLVPSVKSIVAPTSSTSSSHQASYDFYHNVYLPAVNVAPGWTGNHNSCNPGSLSPTFLSAALARVNYFRAMAGLNSDIVWDSNYNQKAQAAALVISVNNNLTHSPPSSSVCYSADALTGAQKSDITKTYLGAEAINIFIEDPGFGNYAVGHRRWILYPGQQKMGIGSVLSGGSGKPAATALYVVGSFVNRKQDVAWPPPGYVPYPVVYQRWSYSKASADFNNATIHVTVNGVRTQYQRASLISGYGDNTIVWSPSMVFPPPNLVTYHVEIGNFFIPSQPGVAQSVEYDVHVFNPNVAP
jgi:uncharacterized protein YkwD